MDLSFISDRPWIVVAIAFGAWMALRFYRFKMVRSQLPHLIGIGAVILDVRTPAEYAQACNPQSINIPLDQLEVRISELDPSRPIVVCCASGTRSAIAAAVLKSRGLQAVNAGPWTQTLLS